jgi:hypothetical protein
MDDADRRVQITKDVHVRTFDGELVILDLARGDYFGVNEVGARLWIGLVAGRTPREIAMEIHGDYEVSPELLLADLVSLTHELIARGLVRFAPVSNP